MIPFWGRDGQPIEDTIEWARLYEDVGYRVVAVDSDGPGQPMVSTIWSGFNMSPNLSDEVPSTIFETAYLEHGHVIDMWRDGTEEAALQRHHMVCLSMLGREPRPQDGHVQTIVEAEKGDG